MVKMPEGRSYTGQDQAEIFCHGGQFVLKKILEEIFKYDVRPAEPGEFTKRAFLAGRIDLARAEAVAEIVASQTEYAYNAAKTHLLGNLSEYLGIIRKKVIELLADIEASIDYPEEDIEPADRDKLLSDIENLMTRIKELCDSYKGGRIIKDGYRIVISGRPNAGKSSLFNLFLNQDRAIVAATPGTTRDYIEEWIDFDGFAVALIDTAGLRTTAGEIEMAGQKTAKALMVNSDLVIWIVDISRRSWKKELAEDLPSYLKGHHVIVALNKIDKLADIKSIKNMTSAKLNIDCPIVPLSCKNRAGFKGMRTKISSFINENMPDLTDKLVVTSLRHKKKLENAFKDLNRVHKGLRENQSPELVAFELRLVVSEIDELTGKIYNDDVLDEIFSRFCIGK